MSRHCGSIKSLALSLKVSWSCFFFVELTDDAKDWLLSIYISLDFLDYLDDPELTDLADYFLCIVPIEPFSDYR